MEDNIDFQDQDEAEEALSLSDLPIDADEPENEDFPRNRDRQPSSEPIDFFEFFSDVSSDMSHAEDIIFCGKLVPFKEPYTYKSTNADISRDENNESFFRRRSGSLPEIKTSQYNSTKTRLTRNSRSMDHRKFQRNSSMSSEPPPDIHRNSSLRSSSGGGGGGGGKVSRPRWYILMFGLMKFPPEMDLQDIKNRQVRKSQSSFSPPADSRKNIPVSRSCRKTSWGILRLLSCKDHASVAVTASFGCMPPM